MPSHQQRLLGLVLAIASAMLFIYGAFYHGSAAPVGALNMPLWLGIAGILGGGALLCVGSYTMVPPRDV